MASRVDGALRGPGRAQFTTDVERGVVAAPGHRPRLVLAAADFLSRPPCSPALSLIPSIIRRIIAQPPNSMSTTPSRAIAGLVQS
jgi:hypothetical protein